MSMFRDQKLRELANKYCFDIAEQDAMARERSRLARNVLRDEIKFARPEEKNHERH